MQDNDLISRAAAIDELKKMVEHHSVHDVFKGELLHYTGIKAMLECLPAVDAVSIRHGHWIDRDGQYECSECHNISCCKGKYCPDCGALMNGGEQNATY